MPRKKLKSRFKSMAAVAQVVPRDRAQDAADLKRMVEEMVEQRVAQLSQGQNAILQPFFQPKPIAYEMLRNQTVPERQKWTHYFAKWGCLICGTTARRHLTLGMCNGCHSRTVARLSAIVRETAAAPDQPRPTFTDTMALAKCALAPSLKVLAADSERKNPYRTDGEAAKEAGIGRVTLWRWISKGLIQHPETRLSPGKWLWNDEDVGRLKAVVRQHKLQRAT